MSFQGSSDICRAKESVLIPVIFGVAIFLLQTNYQYLLYNSLGLLLQLTLFYLSIRYIKGLIPVIIFPFWYYLTGGFAWIFGLMYTVYLLKERSEKVWIKILTLWGISLVFIFCLSSTSFFNPHRHCSFFPYQMKIPDHNSLFLFLLYP